MSKIIRLILLITSMILFTACQDHSHKTLILAHGLDTKHSVHKAMVLLAKRVAELSHNRLEIAIYPNQQLGAERQCIELLQIGSVDMTKVSAAVMEGFAPVYKVLSIPYIFTSRKQEFKVLDGPVGKELLAAGDRFMLHGLCFYDSGSRSFYTKDRPIEKPSDLAGLKIRVMSSPTSIEMVKALGGAATPISWGELYTALQGGVVDGAENNPPSFYLSHHYEVCKYYSLNEHTSIPDVVLISTHTWNHLSSQEKEWINQAARESVIYQRKLWIESEKEALAAVEKAGVKVFYPDKKPFIEALKPLKEKYRKLPEVGRLITEIEQTKISHVASQENN